MEGILSTDFRDLGYPIMQGRWGRGGTIPHVAGALTSPSYCNTVSRLAQPNIQTTRPDIVGISTLGSLGPRALSPGSPCEAGAGGRRGSNLDSSGHWPVESGTQALIVAGSARPNAHGQCASVPPSVAWSPCPPSQQQAPGSQGPRLLHQGNRASASTAPGPHAASISHSRPAHHLNNHHHHHYQPSPQPCTLRHGHRCKAQRNATRRATRLAFPLLHTTLAPPPLGRARIAADRLVPPTNSDSTSRIYPHD